MNAQEKQLIDALFQKLRQTAAQSGPRDPQAEVPVSQHVNNLPGAAYYMAQAIVVQRQALKQAEARIAELERQRSGAFMPQRPAPQQGGGRFPGRRGTDGVGDWRRHSVG